VRAYPQIFSSDVTNNLSLGGRSGIETGKLDSIEVRYGTGSLLPLSLPDTAASRVEEYEVPAQVRSW